MTWLDLADPAHALAIVSPAANSGKSTLVIGLGRLLNDAGISVQPFKAVTVVTADADAAYDGIPAWQWGILHSCRAARVAINHWNNPVSVIQQSDASLAGTLLIWGQPEGEVALSGNDLLDPRTLSRRARRACEDAIADAVNEAKTHNGFLLIEGAGALGDLPPQHDLANWITGPEIRYPTVVSVSVRKSGHVAGAVGAMALLQYDNRRPLAGFIVNQTDGACGLHCPCMTISRHTGVKCLGHVPDTPLLKDYNASAPQLEWLYDRAAAVVAQANPLASRHATLQTALIR